MSIIISPYQIDIANTQEQLNAVYQLRYQVYCQEKNFEPDAQQQNLEQDPFDQQSIHILIREQNSLALVGTIRLIIANDPNQPFHFESLSHQTFELVHDKPRSHYAEVSRLAIAQNFRNQVSLELDAQLKQQTLPPLTLVYAALMVVTNILNIESVCLLEPRFADYLARCGLHTIPIGEAFNHHGTRMPYVLELNHQQRSHHHTLEMLYQTLYEGLKRDVLEHKVAQMVNK